MTEYMYHYTIIITHEFLLKFKGDIVMLDHYNSLTVLKKYLQTDDSHGTYFYDDVKITL